MSESKILGIPAENIPIIRDHLDDPEFMQPLANGLAIGRIAVSPLIGGYILATRPENRSMAVGIATAAVAMTDKADGDIARTLHAHMTKEQMDQFIEQGQLDRGARLDERADKAFVLVPMLALAMKGEVSWKHPVLKYSRDKWVKRSKEMRNQIDGEYPGALPLAKWKALVEMGGVAIGASPLAARTGPDGESSLTEYAFRASNTLSLTTGAQYTADLMTAIIDVKTKDIEELLADARQQQD